MSGGRRRRILAALDDGSGTDVTAVELCGVCRSVTGMSGAGIMLMSGDLPLGSIGTTGAVSALIEDLQYTLGEGPSVDAFQLGRPVLEPDLADPAVPRWMAFTGPALDAGVRAVFGFPLEIGGVRLGALNLFADRPGRPSDISAEAVLVMQAKESQGVLAPELEQGTNFQYVVHQAAGMVSSQLDVSVAQALVRLRAHAFSHQRLLATVAADVVARRLRFDDRNT